MNRLETPRNSSSETEIPPPQAPHRRPLNEYSLEEVENFKRPNTHSEFIIARDLLLESFDLSDPKRREQHRIISNYCNAVEPMFRRNEEVEIREQEKLMTQGESTDTKKERSAKKETGKNAHKEVPEDSDDNRRRKRKKAKKAMLKIYADLKEIRRKKADVLQLEAENRLPKRRKTSVELSQMEIDTDLKLDKAIAKVAELERYLGYNSGEESDPDEEGAVGTL
ncbi:hypothetical protein P167DRAFT_604051 [Morchella conica CCBAS932]|uniref:Uncharacterized protein n=1 Tax=Morchella conica CCBAS932 TaxID=1392247 RepID=A0A3N4KZD1_9PEZI|nr:hypothetical protein P167DRAFT_604051 [Morchella conica CCBAS932]